MELDSINVSGWKPDISLLLCKEHSASFSRSRKVLGIYLGHHLQNVPTANKPSNCFSYLDLP